MDDITMEEVLRRYKAQREAQAQHMAGAGMSPEEIASWRDRTARPEQEITAPFTPAAKALAAEEARRRAFERLAGRR